MSMGSIETERSRCAIFGQRRQTRAGWRCAIQLPPTGCHSERHDDQGQEAVHVHSGRNRLLGRNPQPAHAAAYLQECGRWRTRSPSRPTATGNFGFDWIKLKIKLNLIDVATCREKPGALDSAGGGGHAAAAGRSSVPDDSAKPSIAAPLTFGHQPNVASGGSAPSTASSLRSDHFAPSATASAATPICFAASGRSPSSATCPTDARRSTCSTDSAAGHSACTSAASSAAGRDARSSAAASSNTPRDPGQANHAPCASSTAHSDTAASSTHSGGQDSGTSHSDTATSSARSGGQDSGTGWAGQTSNDGRWTRAGWNCQTSSERTVADQPRSELAGGATCTASASSSSGSHYGAPQCPGRVYLHPAGGDQSKPVAGSGYDAPTEDGAHAVDELAGSSAEHIATAVRASVELAGSTRAIRSAGGTQIQRTSGNVICWWLRVK